MRATCTRRSTLAGRAGIFAEIRQRPRSRARRTVKLFCYVNFALFWRFAMSRRRVASRRDTARRGRFRAIGDSDLFSVGHTPKCRDGYTVVSSFPLHSRKGNSVLQAVRLEDVLLVIHCLRVLQCIPSQADQTVLARVKAKYKIV